MIDRGVIEYAATTRGLSGSCPRDRAASPLRSLFRPEPRDACVAVRQARSRPPGPRLRTLARILGAGAALLVLGGCLSGVDVTIENRTALALGDVTVSGRGFSERVGTIPAGAMQALRVHPRGESGVRVSFSAEGRQYALEDGYIEDDFFYRARVVVDAGFSIRIDTGLK